MIFEKGGFYPIRDGYGKALIKLGAENSSVFVLDADLAKSTRSDWFAEKYPEKFIDCGIAEQNMLGIAAGLASMGAIPFVTTYGVFVAGRAFDQIRNTVCYANLNVKIVGSHGGISVGPDGGSHQAIEDIALMNVLPNMQVFSPVDANEAYKITLYAAKVKSPVFIRLAREATEIITDYSPDEYIPGKFNFLSKGEDAFIFSHGTIGVECYNAVKLLKDKGINVSLINCSSIKPFDNKSLIEIAKKQKPMFVVEEHLEAGGLASIISVILTKNYPVKLNMINLADNFGESGSPEKLLFRYKMTARQIADKVLSDPTVS